MKKLLYIIIPIGILTVLNMITDEQCIIIGWIFIGIWIIKILTKNEKEVFNNILSNVQI